MRVTEVVARADAQLELDTSVRLTEAEWAVVRRALSAAAAARLLDALAVMLDRFGHYAYSQENRQAIAAAKAVYDEFTRDANAKV